MCPPTGQTDYEFHYSAHYILFVHYKCFVKMSKLKYIGTKIYKYNI